MKYVSYLLLGMFLIVLGCGVLNAIVFNGQVQGRVSALELQVDHQEDLAGAVIQRLDRLQDSVNALSAELREQRQILEGLQNE